MRRALLVLILSLSFALAFSVGSVRAQEELPQEGETAGEGTSQTGQVYFYLGDRLAPVPRDIAAGGQTLEFAVMELLNGPSEEERSAGYVTYIPEGVKMQYTTIKQDRSEYSVNLSRDLLALAGDRVAAVKALAQLVKTVREAGDIPVVGVTVASEETVGLPEDAFAALGITAQDVEAEISGIEPGPEPGQGSHTGLVLLLALGIPALAIIAAAVLYAARRRKAGSPGREVSVKKSGARERKSPKREGKSRTREVKRPSKGGGGKGKGK